MKIEQIKQNSTIKLNISTDFYRRLQELTLFLKSSFTDEEFAEAVEKFKVDSEDIDERESSLETVFILVNTIEKVAREQGLVELVTLDTIDNPSASSDISEQ